MSILKDAIGLGLAGLSTTEVDVLEAWTDEARAASAEARAAKSASASAYNEKPTNPKQNAASNASDKADVASKSAKDSAGHGQAAIAHAVARDARADAGNTDAAAAHSKAAEKHMAAVKSVEVGGGAKTSAGSSLKPTQFTAKTHAASMKLQKAEEARKAVVAAQSKFKNAHRKFGNLPSPPPPALGR
jgi:hypothetical protein